MSLGYNMELPSSPPFMYVERHEKRDRLGIIAYGAYNAMGLIGPEKGGVALVLEPPDAAVVATRDVPYDPKERAAVIERLLKGETAADVIALAAEEDFRWRFDPSFVASTLLALSECEVDG